MRFILCCIISLGLLYAAILRHDGYLVDPARLARDAAAIPAQAGGTIAAAAGTGLAAHLDAFCRHDPTACLAGVAALAAPPAMAQAARRGGRVPLGARAP